MTMLWALMHPDATPYDLGFLPSFLDENDPRKAAEQFNERYVYGGWRPFGQDKFKLKKGMVLTYPGDPPLRPIAMTHLRDEVILLFESEMVVILQKDGSFEVARMD